MNLLTVLSFIPTHGVPQFVAAKRLAVGDRESVNRFSVAIQNLDAQGTLARIRVDLDFVAQKYERSRRQRSCLLIRPWLHRDEAVQS